MKRYQWNKKALIHIIIASVIALVAMQCSNWISLAFKDRLEHLDSWRYLQQLCGLIQIVALADILFFQLRKVFPAQLKKDLWDGAGWIFKKIQEGARKIISTVKHALGIPDKPTRVRAKDERSFVFDMEENDLIRRFRNLGSGLKWRDLTSNDDKIRFIYIKYVNKLMKKGYKFSSILTPLETMKKWKLTKSESAYMFPLYTDARYSGGRRVITDEEVERSTKYMKLGAKVDE